MVAEQRHCLSRKTAGNKVRFGMDLFVLSTCPLNAIADVTKHAIVARVLKISLLLLNFSPIKALVAAGQVLRVLQKKNFEQNRTICCLYGPYNHTLSAACSVTFNGAFPTKGSFHILPHNTVNPDCAQVLYILQATLEPICCFPELRRHKNKCDETDSHTSRGSQQIK